MKTILTKITNLIKRGYVTLPNKDAADYSTAQVSYFGKTSYVNTVYPYGMSANAPADTLVLLFNVLGQEENLAGIPYGVGERFKNLKSGEVVFWSPVTKSYIRFSENKDITIYSTGKMVLDSVGGFAYTGKDDYKITCGGNYELNAVGSITFQSEEFGVFGNSTVQQIGGTLTAGATYTTNEQDMINKMFTALKNYGLLT